MRTAIGLDMDELCNDILAEGEFAGPHLRNMNLKKYLRNIKFQKDNPLII